MDRPAKRRSQIKARRTFRSGHEFVPERIVQRQLRSCLAPMSLVGLGRVETPASSEGVEESRQNSDMYEFLHSQGHVWTAPAVQEESDYQRSVRVQSCIRPL